jgi:hypothetical protein
MSLIEDDTILYYDTNNLKCYCLRGWDIHESYVASFENLEELERDIVDNLKEGYLSDYLELKHFDLCDWCFKWLPIADLKTTVELKPNGNQVIWKQCLPCEQGFDNE